MNPAKAQIRVIRNIRVPQHKIPASNGHSVHGQTQTMNPAKAQIRVIRNIRVPQHKISSQYWTHSVHGQTQTEYPANAQIRVIRAIRAIRVPRIESSANVGHRDHG